MLLKGTVTNGNNVQLLQKYFKKLIIDVFYLLIHKETQISQELFKIGIGKHSASFNNKFIKSVTQNFETRGFI